MWEIIDDEGVVYSGTQEEMRKAFDAMTLDYTELMGIYNLNSSQAEFLKHEWTTDWEGDIKLIQIHEINR